jgi:undecaprenyl-phosphate 4-deoxy-4-formamido-L-arabinose transferase
MNQKDYGFTIVIPLYRSELIIPDLLKRLESLSISEPWNVVFVDDGSPDNTYNTIKYMLQSSPINAILVRHTRNYGEHNAVLTGYRYASGEYILNLDDDLQNPPEEALRMLQYARENNFDVVYGNYRSKKHAGWRNIGSFFANLTAKFLLDINGTDYLSSFRCVSRHIAKNIAHYKGPYVYIDGILSQLTSSISSLDVHHDERFVGESSYNMRRLVRLWLVILTGFSLMPLRIAILVGISTAIIGASGLVYAVISNIFDKHQVPGWTSIISSILFFGGIQCLLLGVVGEYFGRIYLAISGKPQSLVRSIDSFNSPSLQSISRDLTA